MVNIKRLILLLYYCISSLLCFDDRILHMHEKDNQVEQVADLPETGVGAEGALRLQISGTMCACAGDLTLQYDTDGIQHATSWDAGSEQNISRPQESKVTSLLLCVSRKIFVH